VAEHWEEYSLVHFHDKSPKYELGRRQLPGQKLLSKGTIFEKDIKEVDNFMRTPPAPKETNQLLDHMKIPKKKRVQHNV